MVELVGAAGREALQQTISATKEFQSQRTEIHRAERSEFLEKKTGRPLMGQKVSGMGQNIDTFA